MTIEAEFEEAMRASCHESRTLGYKPIAFEVMLGDVGAVATPHELLATFKYQDGFRRLWECPPATPQYLAVKGVVFAKFMCATLSTLRTGCMAQSGRAAGGIAAAKLALSGANPT